MAFCINCGQELAEGAKFCAGCGKVVNNNNSTNQRKIIYDGELHKCPNCGEILDSFLTNCPTCGYELRGTKSSSSVQEFAAKLEKIESMREVTKSQFIFTKMFTDGSISKTDEQKINLIRSFSIPNTKEDIYDFIVLAASNIDLKLYGIGDQGVFTASQRAVSDAWMAKFEQAYLKAQNLFPESSVFSNIQKIYYEKTKDIKKEEKKKTRQIVLGFCGLFALMIFFFILAVVGQKLGI